MTIQSSVESIPYEAVDEVIGALCEAFYHYPVMRFVLGPKVEDFDREFPRLIRLFVMPRIFCKDALLGIGGAEGLAAAATVNLPNTSGGAALDAFREDAWKQFTPDARARYKSFVAACTELDPEPAHHYLNMLGVRNAARGQGLSRKLIDAVINMSENHPDSMGVALTTESQRNLPFYEHLGFQNTGHIEIAPGFETWSFFRPN